MIDFEQEGEIEYWDTKFISTFALFDARTANYVKYDDDAKRHLTIQYF